MQQWCRITEKILHSQIIINKTMFKEQYKITNLSKNVNKSLSEKGKRLETHLYITIYTDVGLNCSAGLREFGANSSGQWPSRTKVSQP